MLALMVSLGCRSLPGDTSESEEPYAAVYYDELGLPDCVASISDQAFCANWTDTFALPPEGGLSIGNDLRRQAQDETEFPCADTLVQAEGLFLENSGGGNYTILDVDPRWYEVIHTDVEPGKGASTLLLFRCSYYEQLPWWGDGVYGQDGIYGSSTAWQVAELPMSLALNLEQMRMYADQYVGGNDPYTFFRNYAQGDSGDDLSHVLRTCTLNQAAMPDPEGGYMHWVYQRSFTMDLSTGLVSHEMQSVRDVWCEQPIGGICHPF